MWSPLLLSLLIACLAGLLAGLGGELLARVGAAREGHGLLGNIWLRRGLWPAGVALLAFIVTFGALGPLATRGMRATSPPDDAPIGVPTLALSPASTAPAPSETPGGGAPTGVIAYTCQLFRDARRDQICLMNADGSQNRRLTGDDTAKHFYPSLAPDGASVVYSSNQAGAYDIYEVRLDGRVTRLTDGLGDAYAPEISPDGTQIVFTLEQPAGHQAIWRMERGGGNPRALVDLAGASAWDPTWSPDGAQVLFASDQRGTEDIELFVVNLAGSGMRQVTDFAKNPGGDAKLRGRSDWSPDGRWIATYAGTSWGREIYLFAPDGGSLRRVTSGGNNLAPSFSPDGGWIAFTSYRDRFGDIHGCEIYVMRSDGTDVRRLTDDSDCDWQPRWGP